MDVSVCPVCGEPIGDGLDEGECSRCHAYLMLNRVTGAFVQVKRPRPSFFWPILILVTIAAASLPFASYIWTPDVLVWFIDRFPGGPFAYCVLVVCAGVAIGVVRLIVRHRR